MQDDGYHAELGDRPDLTAPLRERLAEVGRLLEPMRALDAERQRILRALDALDPRMPVVVAVPAPTTARGVTRQEGLILTVLNGHDEKLRARDIADELGLGDSTSIHSALKRMWQRGFVVRHEIGTRQYAWESASAGRPSDEEER